MEGDPKSVAAIAVTSASGTGTVAVTGAGATAVTGAGCESPEAIGGDGAVADPVTVRADRATT